MTTPVVRPLALEQPERSPDKNPDVIELKAANRAGCDHPEVEHKIPKEQIEAYRAAGGILGLSGFVAAGCRFCGQMVPTDPPKKT